MYFTDRGLEELADRRGEEQVTLAWMADQMQAFVDQFPDFEVPVERLATWLARGGADPTSTTSDGVRSSGAPPAQARRQDGGTLCACSVTRMPSRASPRARRRCPGRRSTARSPRSPGSRRSVGSPCCPTSTIRLHRLRTCGGRSPTCPRARSAGSPRGIAGERTTPSSVRSRSGRWPYAAAGAFWSSLLLLALAIGLALRALNFAIPGRVENTVVGNLVLSWGGAWLLLAHSPEPGLAAVGRRPRLPHPHRRRRAHLRPASPFRCCGSSSGAG